MSNAKIRLVICMGRTCNATGQAEPLYAELEKQLGEPSDFRCTKRVRWERANCLSHCGKGPNLAFYPAAEVFHAVDKTQLQAIIAQFLAYRATHDENENKNGSSELPEPSSFRF